MRVKVGTTIISCIEITCYMNNIIEIEKSVDYGLRVNFATLEEQRRFFNDIYENGKASISDYDCTYRWIN